MSIVTDADVRRRTSILPFLPYAVIGASHVLLLALDVSVADTVSKAMLMPALAFGFVRTIGGRPRAATVVALVAIGLSWAGDVLLGIPGDVFFLVGLVAFLLALVAYTVLFATVLRTHQLRRWTLVYVVWFIVFLAVLAPHLGVLAIPVGVYGAALAGTVVCTSLGGRLTAIGGAFFVASDTLLAVERFVPGSAFPGDDPLIMVGYILAQGAIIVGVARLIDGRSSRNLHDLSSMPTSGPAGVRWNVRAQGCPLRRYMSTAD